jgi:hypothetical protein
MSEPVQRHIKSDYDRLIAKAADLLIAKRFLVEDPYYKLKGCGVVAGAAREISFADAGMLVLKLAQEGKSLQAIEVECERGAKRSRP